MRARMQCNIYLPLDKFVNISFSGYYVLELKYIPGIYYVNTYQGKKKKKNCFMLFQRQRTSWEVEPSKRNRLVGCLEELILAYELSINHFYSISITYTEKLIKISPNLQINSHLTKRFPNKCLIKSFTRAFHCLKPKNYL
ncbi:hypothetical protein V8G54_020823 [Vigna mungo]|uniref:Uncharacterized protein n=1 Tax=Vigna mungo TaxID=3915 RepID=A0AAQ3NEN0_VIGMU